MDRELLLLLFDLVDATYIEDDEQAVQAAEALAIGPVTLLEPLGPARALVVPTKAGTVVAVRGSGAANPRELWLNAWINLVAVPVRPVDLGLKRGLVHGGYFGTAASLFDGVMEALEGLEDGAPVYLTGFSLGGAVAQCLALAVAHARSELAVRPVTFASPKLGTARLAKELTRLGLHRVEVDGDLIPSLPPWPYAHGGASLDLIARAPALRQPAHARGVYGAALNDR